MCRVATTCYCELQKLFLECADEKEEQKKEQMLKKQRKMTTKEQVVIDRPGPYCNNN